MQSPYRSSQDNTEYNRYDRNWQILSQQEGCGENSRGAYGTCLQVEYPDPSKGLPAGVLFEKDECRCRVGRPGPEDVDVAGGHFVSGKTPRPTAADS